MKLSSIAIALSAVLALAGCDNSAVISPEQQMGPDPTLPAAQDFLMPPMQVPKGVGWQQNQMPKVAEGLKIDKVADGLLHPRSGRLCRGHRNRQSSRCHQRCKCG